MSVEVYLQIPVLGRRESEINFELYVYSVAQGLMVILLLQFPNAGIICVNYHIQ